MYSRELENPGNILHKDESARSGRPCLQLWLHGVIGCQRTWSRDGDVQAFSSDRTGAWYKAMQFNFVASSNEGAVRLWNKLGFTTVGRLPKAFRHPSKGYVDALVLYKSAWSTVTSRLRCNVPTSLSTCLLYSDRIPVKMSWREALVPDLSLIACLARLRRSAAAACSGGYYQ